MRKIPIVILIALSLLLSNLAISQPYIWGGVGPAPIAYSSYKSVSGRVWGISVSPPHSFNGNAIPANMFIAVDRGGIWRSNDFTTPEPTWIPISDKWARLFYAETITVDPYNPSRLLVPVNQMIMVSEDNGNTWDTLGKNVFSFSGPTRKVIIDPTAGGGDIMYGLNGTFRGGFGLFKSTDRGVTWTKLNMPVFRTIWDLEYTITTDNKLILFAGLGSSGIWQSIDGGGTWTKTSIGLMDVTTQAIVDSANIGIISLAADHTPGWPNGIYAFIYNAPSQHILNTFSFKKNNWFPVATNLTSANNYDATHGLSASSGFQALGLSETGAVYQGAGDPLGSPIYQTTDAGNHWYSIQTSMTTPAFTPHTDIHCFAFYGGKIYTGTDGGVYRFNPLSQNQPGNSVWESLNSLTLQSVLVNGVGVHPTNSQILLCGSWDNGIARGVNQSWTSAISGDNSKVLFDPDPAGSGNYAYATSGNVQYDPVNKTIHVFERSTDQGQSWNDASPPDAFNVYANSDFYAPFAIDPVNPSRIALGIDRVYETPDKGDTWSKQISPVFSPAGLSPTGLPIGAQATAIAYGLNQSIWVAYNDSLYESTNDGGDGSAANWTFMNSGVNFGLPINKIVVDPQFGEVYISTENAVWLYAESSVTGTWSWRNITSNLFNATVSSVNNLCLIPKTGGIIKALFAATNGGVYVTFDDGGSWAAFSFNLPRGSVTDLQYSAHDQTLFAGVYGRGIYKTSLANILNPANIPNITITVPRPRDNCGDIVGPVQGSTIDVSYSLSNPLDNGGYTAVWTVQGAGTVPGESVNASTFTITNLSADVTLQVDIYFANGLKISRAKQFSPITALSAAGMAFFCELKNNGPIPIPWWRWDPELTEYNPLTNSFVQKKLTRAQLINTQRRMTITLQQVNKLIRNLKE